MNLSSLLPPQLNIARIAAYGALIAGVLVAVWLWGYSRGEMKLFDYQAKQATQAVKVARARDVVTERVVDHYITKVVPKTQVVTETVEKEIVKYVETNSSYCLDARWGELHDAAAKDELPPSAIVAHGAGGAPTAATAIETVAENYGACNRTADRLDALQSWVREQLVVEE